MDGFTPNTFLDKLVHNIYEKREFFNTTKLIDSLLSTAEENGGEHSISAVTLMSMWLMLYAMIWRLQNADELSDDLRDIQPLSAAIVAYLRACDS